MLFDIPFLADWNKIGDHSSNENQSQYQRENKSRVDWDYKIGDKVLRQEGILHKSESNYHKDPWTVSTVHTEGTIRVHHSTKSERLNIRRVTPYFDMIDTYNDNC
eukprot:CCRYP_020865-RA/>CCRYP_020865-RA protein AED:0.44 eAED:0.44 QI:0/-1/0/1/-1/0/1/0/104